MNLGSLRLSTRLFLAFGVIVVMSMPSSGVGPWKLSAIPNNLTTADVTRAAFGRAEAAASLAPAPKAAAVKAARAPASATDDRESF